MAAGSGAGVSVAHLGIGPRTLRCLALGSLRMELPRRQSFVTDTQAVPTAHGLNAAVEEPPVVVVGGGPSGLRVAQELARRNIAVIQFNAERWRPYNRLKLTPFLAGEVQIGIVYQAESVSRMARALPNIPGRPSSRSTAQPRRSKISLAGIGTIQSWFCVLARIAHIPPIPGPRHARRLSLPQFR